MNTESFIERNETVVKAVSSFAEKLLDSYVGTVRENIRTGGVNGAQGLIGEMIWADLLHGGAYRWDYPVGRLPYYNQNVVGALSFTTNPIVGAVYSVLGATSTFTIPDGYPGAGVTVTMPSGASTLQLEVLSDGYVPHILPKLLSDQTYIQVMERCGQLLNIAEFNTLGTGVQTWVEAATEAAGAVTGPLGARRAQDLEWAKAILAASTQTARQTD